MGTFPDMVFLTLAALGLDSTAPHSKRRLLAKLQLDARQALEMFGGQARTALGQTEPGSPAAVRDSTSFRTWVSSSFCH